MPHSHSYFCVLSFEYAQETVLSFPVKIKALQGLWIERGPPNSKRQNCAGGIDFPGKTAGTLVPARQRLLILLALRMCLLFCVMFLW